ncbi:MAG: hypothetical protein OSA93_13930 [Akkermansiaceae bacterium]|nr:hypothetical protein [Akkermansiaceae bacterium]
MILQRESKVPVWGFGQPGSQVTGEFAGQTKTAVGDKYGAWMLKLDPLKVSFEKRGFQVKIQVKNKWGESLILKSVNEPTPLFSQ